MGAPVVGCLSSMPQTVPLSRSQSPRLQWQGLHLQTLAQSCRSPSLCCIVHIPQAQATLSSGLAIPKWVLLATVPTSPSSWKCRSDWVPSCLKPFAVIP